MAAGPCHAFPAGLNPRPPECSGNSQGGVQFPTGGTARERVLRDGQQIRCNSWADGIVRMKEMMKAVPLFAGVRCHIVLIHV